MAKKKDSGTRNVEQRLDDFFRVRLTTANTALSLSSVALEGVGTLKDAVNDAEEILRGFARERLDRVAADVNRERFSASQGQLFDESWGDRGVKLGDEWYRNAISTIEVQEMAFQNKEQNAAKIAAALERDRNRMALLRYAAQRNPEMSDCADYLTWLDVNGIYSIADIPPEWVNAMRGGFETDGPRA